MVLRSNSSRSPTAVRPRDPGTPTIARRLYESVAGPADRLHARSRPSRMASGSSALRRPDVAVMTPDHSVNRMMHAHGVPVRPGVGHGQLFEAESRGAIRIVSTIGVTTLGAPLRRCYPSVFAGAPSGSTTHARPSAASAWRRRVGRLRQDVLLR